MACSVELFLWKPDCFSYRRPLESRWLLTLLYIILPKTWKYRKDGYETIYAYVVFVNRFEYQSYFSNLQTIRKYSLLNSSKFNSSNCIFSLWDVKNSWIFFQCWGFFCVNFDSTEVKNLLNSLIMSCGFCIMVLSTLISWGRRFHFLFCFPVISFITCQVRLESV